jgi:putative glycosyltransferase
LRISIVTTLYRSSAYIDEFYKRIVATVNDITPDYEIVFVNDGSPDDSMDVALSIYRNDKNVSIVDLSRNFGHHKAMMTGLAYAQGDLIFLIDVDLEDPPELLAEFYARYQQGDVDVVYGVQSTRQGSWFRRITGNLAYKTLNFFMYQSVPANLLTVRLMSKRYVDQLSRHQERLFIIGGLWSTTGFEQVPIPVEKSFKSLSSYSLFRRLSLLINGIISFSNKPLLYIAYIGVFMTFTSIVAICYFLILDLIGQVGVPGWLTVVLSVWFMGGLNIFVLGIIALYISVIFQEIKQRPYTIIRELHTHETLDESVHQTASTSQPPTQ